MRFPRHPAALVAALTLAGSVAAAPRTRRAPKLTPVASQELSERLARAELLAGITEVTGPGLIVTLRHCPHVPKGEDPKAFWVLDQDVNGVLNALRAAGAEALAVSGARPAALERVLVTTAVKSDEDGLLINGTKLLPPYRILALGSGDAMRTELFRPGGVVKKAHLDELQMIELQNVPELVLPACLKTAEPKFARAATPGVTSASIAGRPALPDGAAPAELPRTPTAPAEFPQPTGGPSSPSAQPNRVVAIVPRSKTPATREPAKLPPVKPEPSLPKPIEKEPVAERNPPPVAKTPPVAPPTRPMAAGDLGLFGGKGLAKYHAAGCRFGERIDRSERIHFTTAEAAHQAGRVPCSICLPDPSTSR